MRATKFQRQQGFTLIELLVVVAIILILANLLLPVLDSAQAKTRTIKCMNNLRQIGIGMAAFANDNDGRIPDTPWGLGPGLCGGASWANCVWDSVIDYELHGLTAGPGAVDEKVANGSSRMFICPEAKWVWQPCPGCSCPAQATGGVYPRSYAINGAIQTQGYRLGTISNPGRVIYVAERNCPPSQGQTCGSCSNIGGPGTGDPYATPNPPGPATPGWHNGKSNFLFLDGHVQLMSAVESALPGTTGSPAGSWTVNPNDD